MNDEFGALPLHSFIVHHSYFRIPITGRYVSTGTNRYNHRLWQLAFWMALSPDCIEQHQKEWAITRRYLGWGLVCAAGFYGGMMGLLRSQPSSQTDVETIELVILAAEADSAAVALESSPPSQTIAAAAPTESEVPKRLENPKAPEPSAESEAVQESKGDQAAEDLEEPAESETTADSSEKTKIAEEAEEPEATGDLENKEPAEEDAKPSAEGTDSPDDSSTGTGETSATPAETDPLPGNGSATVATSPAGTNRGMVVRNVPAAVEGDGRVAETAGAETTNAKTPGAGSAAGAPSARSQAVATGSTAASETRTFGCVNCFQPAYPEAAKTAGAEGAPRVSYDVDANGNVIGVSLAVSSGNAALDAAALAAVQRYQFTPGGQGRTRMLEINFSLEGTDRNRSARRQGERRQVQEQVPVEPIAESAETLVLEEQESAESSQVTESSAEIAPGETTSSGETTPSETINEQAVPETVPEAEPQTDLDVAEPEPPEPERLPQASPEATEPPVVEPPAPAAPAQIPIAPPVEPAAPLPEPVIPEPVRSPEPAGPDSSEGGEQPSPQG